MGNIPKGWHHEDIKAAIRKKGITLFKLSVDAGLEGSTVRKSLKVSCPAGERAISGFLGVSLHELWPDRYDAQNRQIRRSRHSTARPRRPQSPKASAA